MNYKIYISLVCLLCACSTSKDISKLEIKKLDWIIGNWQNNSAEGIFRESWSELNDSTFKGMGSFQSGNEMVFSEDILLQRSAGNLYYIVTAGEQNGSKPVTFKCTKGNPKHLIFENPDHDFPTKITYRKIRNDSIVAEIYGNNNGTPMVQLFPMKRVK